MNILVIGAAGFLGSHLAKKLSAAGYKVVGIDTDLARAKQVLNKNISFYGCDFGTQFSVKNIINTERIELIIQCAGNKSMGQSAKNPMACYTNNVLGNIFLFDTLLKESVNKFIYISSAAVFGEADIMPITDKTAKIPTTPLGHTELFVEHMLDSFRQSYDISYAIVRHSTLCGLSEIENEYFFKNPQNGLIGNIIKYILNEIQSVDICGTCYDTIDRTLERDYIHIDDFCSACVNILPKLAIKGEGLEYNIGSGKKYSVKEVIEIAEKICGTKIKTSGSQEIIGEPARIYFDITKARLDLEWSTKYDSLEKILETVLPYYLKLQR